MGPQEIMESSIDIIDIIKLAVSVLVVVIPALVALGVKISKIEAASGEINTKLENVTKDFDQVDKDLSELRAYCEKLDNIDREGRKELWQETNGVRERLTVVETKLAKNGN